MTKRVLDSDEETSIEGLLREVGPRDLPSPAIQADVRAAVRAEWEAVVRAGARRKRVWLGTIAAGAAATAVGVSLIFFVGRWPERQARPAMGELVATVSSVRSDSPVGHVQVRTVGQSSWQDLAAGTTLHADTVLRTDAATRVALTFAKGLSLSIDSGTVLQFAAADSITLEQGRVYVDSDPVAHVPLTIHTTRGALTHLGTQYQVQIIDNMLTVGVREGRVALQRTESDAARTLEIVANQRVRIAANGELARDGIASYGPEWAWTLPLIATFDIEDQTLADFLKWAARETGRNMEYSSDAVRRQAEQTKLHGSIAGMSVEQALTAVMATTTLSAKVSSSRISVGP